jgi:hypothetical protein
MPGKVQKASEVKVDTITFSEPKKLPNGGNMVYVNGFDSLYVQTPKVNVLWDTKFYAAADKPENGKYSIQFSMTDIENNVSMKDFNDMLTSMDVRIVKYAYENRKEWFGAKFSKTSEETIESLYTPMVKISTDEETGEPNGKFPPRFGFKINKYDNVHQCKVYDSDKNLFNIDNPDEDDYKSLADDVLVKGASMNVVLKCNGIWVINGKFGCTWKAEQVKVKVPEKAISGYAFRDDDDEDDMDVVSESNDKVEHELESDSDSDSDSDDEDAEIVEKTVKKRGGVKKE